MKNGERTDAMRAMIVFFLLAGVLILSGGCASYTSVSLSTNQSKPVSMTSNINKEYSVMKHIRVVQKVPFLFLLRINPENANPNLDELLQPVFAETPADAIVNVRLQGSTSLGDVILPIGLGIAGGLVFAPLFVFVVTPFFEDLKTYSLEGDIVRYSESSKPSEPKQKFDPVTGLPTENPTPRFDPATGLPMKP